jgi:hypothetical protein
MAITTFSEIRRDVRQFVQEHRELWDGSEAAKFTVDPGVAEYEILMDCVRDACHAAARSVASRFGLDMRQRDDYAEAYKILAEEDPSWSASSFDGLSEDAQDRVLFAAQQRMRLHTNGSHYGRPVTGRRSVMEDVYAQARTDRMLQIAQRDNIDLSTVDGRSVALQRAVDENPSLKIPQGRGFTLRRGQPPVGEPVGAAKPRVGPGSPNRPFTEWKDYSKPQPQPASAAGTDGAGGIQGACY